jgi:geranylgeranylglycerol-phosphate geranylgeranyltransferase
VGGLVISETSFDLEILVLASISAFLIAAGGNVINDIYDVEIDKVVHPNRVLPSEKVSIKNAKTFYVLLNLLSIIILLFTNFYLLIVVIISIVALFLYSKILKRYFIVSNFLIATLTGLTFIFAGLAVNNVENSYIPALFAFMINLIREIIKDAEDVEGDIKHKIFSLPIVLGLKKTKIIVQTLLILLILFTAYPFIVGIYKIEYFIVVMIFVNSLLVLTIKLLDQSVSINNFKIVSKLLKTSMLIGLIAIYLGK